MVVIKMLSKKVVSVASIFSFVSALCILCVSGSAAAEPPSHLVARVQVESPKNVRISDEAKNQLQTKLSEALKSDGFISPDSPLTLVVSIEGFLVRSGNTPTLLRQQGGRDILRGSISLRDEKGVTQIDKMKLSFSFEGFENLSPDGRQDRLFTACTHSVIDALK